MSKYQCANQLNLSNIKLNLQYNFAHVTFKQLMNLFINLHNSTLSLMFESLSMKTFSYLSLIRSIVKPKVMFGLRKVEEK